MSSTFSEIAAASITDTLGSQHEGGRHLITGDSNVAVQQKDTLGPHPAERPCERQATAQVAEPDPGPAGGAEGNQDPILHRRK